jgi:hypothetical protein
VARKPLSIAFEEIAGDKIVLAHPSEIAPDESEGAGSAEAVAEGDQSGDGGERDGAE